MTAKVGTPITIPTKPIKPPNSKMENSTQKLDSPVESPKIFGPKKFPSTCCSTRIKIKKYTHLIGLAVSIIRAQGIAPMNGPKKGIMLVTPTITLISMVYGILSRFITTKQRIPIMRESKSFPSIKPPNTG